MIENGNHSYVCIEKASCEILAWKISLKFLFIVSSYDCEIHSI